MSLVHRATFVVLLAAVPLLAGCTPTEPTPSASPTTAASPSSSAEPTPEPEPVFVAPTTCAELIGPDLAAQFAADNIVVFDSSSGEGIYAGGGDRVIAQDGGDPFWCIFGKDMVDLSSFQLVAQPVSSEDEHEGIVAVLGSQNFTQSLNGSTVTFSDPGTDTDPLPAVIHQLEQDRWLTAYAGFGGDRQLETMTGYLEAMAAHLAG